MEAENKQNYRLAPTGKGEMESRMPASQAFGQLAEMEKLFDRLMGHGWPIMPGWSKPMGWQLPWWNEMFEGAGMRLPSIDVLDRETDILVRAELPGVDKKDLEISLVDHTLNIKSSIRQEEKSEKGDFHWREIVSSAYSRSVTLPAAVDVAKVSAFLRNGILEIALPKVEAAKKHHIAIQEGK